MSDWIKRLKKLGKTQYYVRIFQITTLLPLLYIFVASAQASLFVYGGFPGILFDLGIGCLPRAEVYLMSVAYHLTRNELVIYFGILVYALVFGMVINRLLSGKSRTKHVTRMVLAACIGCDLIVRLLPIRLNTVLPVGYLIAGLAVRAVCLWLVLSEEAEARKKERNAGEKGLS